MWHLKDSPYKPLFIMQGVCLSLLVVALMFDHSFGEPSIEKQLEQLQEKLTVLESRVAECQGKQNDNVIETSKD
ncbi:hypothetical protein HG15A2_29440 [Adhaeretor mobilis]|uniref:Uncharacterized protein n=1 Tax=Adhaeretor mobilis TaxID=1930276 RepID=A0A517MXK6_9BACT|nr:hypothetical protein HG15A2_29440 [Adhaeretor mobilis]